MEIIGIAAMVVIGWIILGAIVQPFFNQTPREVPAGKCWRCGYDLRATPNCCPECGEVNDV